MTPEVISFAGCGGKAQMPVVALGDAVGGGEVGVIAKAVLTLELQR
ncbi:hypothetical protein [Streptomyces wuyuanensis]